MKKFLSVIVFTILFAEPAFAQISTRPWDGGATWSAKSIAQQIAEVTSWITQNIAKRVNLTVAPWDRAEYAAKTEAQKVSDQIEWTNLKQRVGKNGDSLEIWGRNKIVTNTNATKEYFIPNKTQAEWDGFVAAVNAGKMPGVSITEAYTYSWSVGSFGSCSASCGGGTQTRSVTCLRSDNATVADSFCNTAKPIASQSCYATNCTIWSGNLVSGNFNTETLNLPLQFGRQYTFYFWADGNGGKVYTRTVNKSGYFYVKRLSPTYCTGNWTVDDSAGTSGVQFNNGAYGGACGGAGLYRVDLVP